ncbi:MAG: TolC family protein [Phycisphaerae bacterium]|jgi:outer membrane protein TolC|nr:TolC family protein [Phycisphaerae bacterium]
MCKFITHLSVLPLIFLVSGCSSPFKEPTTLIDPKLEITAIIDKLPGSSNQDQTITLPITTPSAVEQSLRHRTEEIELLVPANSELGWDAHLGFGLRRNKINTKELTVEKTISLALENNLEIQIATIKPSISEQAVEEAEAVFDFVFGASASTTKTKTPQQQALVGGVPITTSESSSNVLAGNATLSKLMSSGGTLAISTDVTRTNNESTGTQFSPDPAWQTIGTLDFKQPLLRNFGETITLAQVRLSEISHRQSKEELQNTLNTIITSAEQTYFELILQWKTLQVKTWLLEQGEQVVEVLDIRRTYDTGEADYAQAVATVQQRKSDVITQQALVQKTSDALKQLINTDEYPLDSETVIQPAGAIEATPITISLRQALLTALQNRPDIKKLILFINAEAINIQVADNARMPQLDMQAQLSFHGLGESAGGGYQEVFDTDYINYLAGLSFESPFGNRAAEAKYTAARLQKMSAVASYKQGIQKATIEVKTALRDVITNAELIHANKSFRIAQTENLRALGVEEETMAGLSPTFLNLKLQTQAGLANARILEFSAIINYNKAIADLYLSMGTTLQMHQIEIK